MPTTQLPDGWTEAQEATLRRLCEGYRVEFNYSDYFTKDFSLPSGYVTGWIGGKPGTIYVGVDSDGAASS